MTLITGNPHFKIVTPTLVPDVFLSERVLAKPRPEEIKNLLHMDKSYKELLEENYSLIVDTAVYKLLGITTFRSDTDGSFGFEHLSRLFKYMKSRGASVDGKTIIECVGIGSPIWPEMYCEVARHPLPNYRNKRIPRHWLSVCYREVYVAKVVVPHITANMIEAARTGRIREWRFDQ